MTSRSVLQSPISKDTSLPFRFVLGDDVKKKHPHHQSWVEITHSSWRPKVISYFAMGNPPWWVRDSMFFANHFWWCSHAHVLLQEAAEKSPLEEVFSLNVAFLWEDCLIRFVTIMVMSCGEWWMTSFILDIHLIHQPPIWPWSLFSSSMSLLLPAAEYITDKSSATQSGSGHSLVLYSTVLERRFSVGRAVSLCPFTEGQLCFVLKKQMRSEILQTFVLTAYISAPFHWISLLKLSSREKYASQQQECICNAVNVVWICQPIKQANNWRVLNCTVEWGRRELHLKQADIFSVLIKRTVPVCFQEALNCGLDVSPSAKKHTRKYFCGEFLKVDAGTH